MDHARAGDYFTMIFTQPKTFNAFRFQCRGSSHSLQNVFDIKYYNSAQSVWVTVGTTATANRRCSRGADYAEWGGTYTATKWQFVLTKHYGGPWYHGFSWYSTGSDASPARTGT